MTDATHLSHEHCWHEDTTSQVRLAIWPPAIPRVCCFCGAREMYRPPQPPIPNGHGPFYPRPHPYTVTFMTNASSSDS